MIDKEILNTIYKDDESIEKQAANQIESLKKQYSDNWEETLKSAGYEDEAELKEYFVLNYQRNQAIEDKVKGSIKDDEINAYYKENTVGDISAKHILIKVDTDSEDGLTDDEAKKKAEEEIITIKPEIDKLKGELQEVTDKIQVYEKSISEKTTEINAMEREIIKKLDKGEDFDTLAKENSDDTGSKEKGGDLGYFNKGDMVEEFENAAYKLKVNEYTKEPVKTTYGYHIILKTGEKDKPKLKEVKDNIIKALTDEKLDEDKALQVTALDDLRKSYGLKFKDAKLKKNYNNYIKEAIKQAEESKSNSSSQS